MKNDPQLFPLLPSSAMRSFLPSLFTSSLFAFALAGPHISPYTLHEKRSHVPSGWTRSHRHQPDAHIPLRFGLTQSNIDDIENLLDSVSNPDSPNYGKHWSPAQIATHFAPSETSVETVREWLIGHGITVERIRLSGGRNWIELNATVAEAELLFLTEYHIFTHETGVKHLGASTSPFISIFHLI